MNEIFKRDLYRYVGKDCTKISARLRGVLCTPGIQYTYIMRKVQFSRFAFTKFFWTMCLHICKIITTIQIPPSTKIGYGLRILHFGNIVVNPEAVIGNNFNIAQGVLIGGAEGAKKGYPVIGNNCCAYANSLIIGGYILEMMY